ncbi:serine/threonine-protein kinase [Candidatus Uabimicrobium sp. HlEnr_7]|uniref:serine/threonine-protein kinase n=1 Tax=Candidatus Uabimicrobium helgolandensis TaxID=3095367 RepID=UPI003557C777
MNHELIGSYLGKYKIISISETNNSSITFHAFDTESDVKKLVVIFKESYAQTEKQKQKLYKILLDTTKWSHPNIITPEEISYEKNTFYAGFPFYEQSLADICQKSGVITTMRALGIAKQIGQALSYAHEKNVLHTNINPFSIFAAPNGSVKILGFGFIPEIDFWIHSDIIDCPFYSAPELVIENKISPASDLYSLGTTLFHLLSGLMPFEGETTEAIFQQIAFSSTPSIQKHRPNISSSINNLILRLMAKKPKDRFSSVNEFLRALHDVSTENKKTGNKKVEDVFLSMIKKSKVPIEQVVNILETISNQRNVKSQAKSLMERIAIQELSEKLNCNPKIIEAIKNNKTIIDNPKEWLQSNIGEEQALQETVNNKAPSKPAQEKRIIKSGRSSEYLNLFTNTSKSSTPINTHRNKMKATSTRVMDFEAFKEARQTPIRNTQPLIRNTQPPKTPISQNINRKSMQQKPSTETHKVPEVKKRSLTEILMQILKLGSLALFGIIIVAGIYIFLSPYLQQELKNWFLK